VRLETGDGAMRRDKKRFYRVFPSVEAEPGSPIFTGKDDMKGFNEFRFYKGKLIEDWPEGITFFVKGVLEDDYVLVGLHWIVVSERVCRVFEECEVKGAQFLPVHIVVEETGKELGAYWVINVFQEVDALDWEHTEWIDKWRDDLPVVNAFRVAVRREPLKNIDIFRLNVKGRGHPGVYISERLKKCLDQAGATSGFEFVPIEAY